MNEAERNNLRSDLISAQLDVARLRAALNGSESEFHPPAAAPPSLVAIQRQFLVSQTGEFAAKALDRQRAQKEAERATAKLDATIPLFQERVNISKGLADKELVSKIIYLETLHQPVDQQQDHKVQESRYREAEAALAAITKTIAQAAAEYRRTLSSDLVEAERKVAGISEDLIKSLTAPVDGGVQQLAVHTRIRFQGLGWWPLLASSLIFGPGTRFDMYRRSWSDWLMASSSCRPGGSATQSVLTQSPTFS
jgi:hemolysin D